MSTQETEEVFEFVDYTSVSNFERLVTFLEDVLISWEVKDGLYGVFSDEHLETAHAALTEPSAATFTRHETFTQENQHFTFTYHCYPTTKQSALLDDYYCFLDSHHALHRWTGQQRFLLLTGSEPKYLISACAIAFQNTGCTVPVFVPMGQSKHQMFIGYKLVSDQPGDALNETETRYNMSLTSFLELSTLDGLVNRFKRKVDAYRDDIGMEEGGHENMASSVAYTFSLKNWFDENWKDGTEKRHSVDSWDQQVKTLPFGSFNDPLRELTLTVLFQDDLNEHTFHVGLDTKQKWFLSRAFAPKNQQRAFLSTLLEKVIRSWMTDPSNANYSPHRGLVHSLMTAVHSRTDTEKEQVTVIRSEQVERVIHAVFEEPAIKAHPTTIKLAPSFKSPAVPCGSLLWNTLFYSLELLSKNANTSAIGFFKIIWSELLRKIRWHWKHLVPLPHIETLDKEQTIDLRFNIIHQKLVMIHCCIQRKLKDISKKEEEDDFCRETLSSSASSSFAVDDDDDSSSDIFYDSIQEKEQPDTKTSMPISESFVQLPYTPGTDMNPYSSYAYDDKVEMKDPDKMEGVLCTHASLTLLKTKKPMNIPMTQEPGLMTLDMLELQAEKFESLGSSDNATQLRAKLQSAQLYSDMQAFKAANPQACLEDFVQWHSPRDWVDGHLSARMSESNNIWQELWKCSKRIPCVRQKPLFDVSGEAEKALCDLEKTSIHAFFAIMLPTIGLIAYDGLASHPIVNRITPVSLGISRLEGALVAFRWNDFCEGKASIHSLLESIRQQESIMCYAISLLRKLPKQYSLVGKLLSNIQVGIEDDERNAVFQLFKNEHDVIAEPSFKEYLVYNDIKLDDRCLPLRQYALVKDNQVRIVDLHTTDALFS